MSIFFKNFGPYSKLRTGNFRVNYLSVPNALVSSKPTVAVIMLL